jgi:predicted secreted protein
MRTRFLALFTAAAFVSLLAGAGCPGSSQMLVVDGRDDGSTVQLHVGDTVRIYLASESGTGRGWQDVLDYDFYVIDVIEAAPVTNPNANADGSRTLFEETWEAKKVGTTAIHMKYGILSDPNSTTDAFFTLNVQVTP